MANDSRVMEDCRCKRFQVWIWRKEFELSFPFHKVFLLTLGISRDDCLIFFGVSGLRVNLVKDIKSASLKMVFKSWVEIKKSFNLLCGARDGKMINVIEFQKVNAFLNAIGPFIILGKDIKFGGRLHHNFPIRLWYPLFLLMIIVEVRLIYFGFGRQASSSGPPPILKGLMGRR